ncbi:MAG: iron-sulfur cluster assembly accessory protein [Holosporales bacterium]|jgi:iron-sulfur cluster assembly protein|nr:iron-sulfur cluster assembly accessory protein [Holosporales bacterium]
MVNISVTTTALDKIGELLQEQQPSPVGVRIFVYQDETGVNHNMSFTNDISTTDEVFDVGGITFIADVNSSMFLNNIVLDFVTVGLSSGFVFQNECATRSCLTCNGMCRKQ